MITFSFTPNLEHEDAGYPVPPPVTYRLDQANRIILLNDMWEVFAEKNSGLALDRDHVLGQSIINYITGRETKHLYDIILKKVRQIKKPTVVTFRCDAPEERRFMKLKISPLPDDPQTLDCVCRQVKSELRRPIRLLMDQTPRSNDLLVMCSWCKQVKVDGNWFEVEEAIERLGLFFVDRLPGITHGCCGPCQKTYWEI